MFNEDTYKVMRIAARNATKTDLEDADDWARGAQDAVNTTKNI